MTKKERARLLVEGLKKEYPDAICSLVADNPFELLVATRLSAQCTDARVNLVTPALFNKYRTLDDYVNADVKDIENIIHSCGFYHGKARDIIEMARGVRDRFGGVVPDNIEDLTTLSGVGRKTANLVLAKGFNLPAICVDVHVHRICNRLGFLTTKTPDETEMKLRETLPKKFWTDFNTLLVTHGQNICKPQKPLCDKCSISELCKSKIVK